MVEKRNPSFRFKDSKELEDSKSKSIDYRSTPVLPGLADSKISQLIDFQPVRQSVKVMSFAILNDQYLKLKPLPRNHITQAPNPQFNASSETIFKADVPFTESMRAPL